MNLHNLKKYYAQLLRKQINKKNAFIFFLLSFILIKCANQIPPAGGEVDKIPPSIVEVYPPDGTTNYDENYFELNFSEYVDKRSVRDAIFISPFIEGTFTYSWSGTTLEVTFPEKLKDDVTYTKTIGTDAVDLNNKNRMAQAFTFSFSTGSKIDRRIISGRVYGKEKEGIFIYAYKMEESSDSLLNRKPDYVSQTGIDGNFSLQGLGAGNYRIFAVNDQFKDYLYQQDQDEIGIPHNDIYLSETDSIFIDQYFLLFDADVSKPRLISGIMTDRYHMLVSANKVLDNKSIYSENFSIVDSTENKVYEVAYAFKGKTKPEEFILMFDAEINPVNQVYLVSDTLIDLMGNIMINDFTKVVVSDRTDTSSLDQNYNVPGFAEESGAWRVGIDFDTSPRNYPFRWAVGGPGDLITQTIGGKVYYYLPPDSKAVVTGGIKITNKPPRDPFYFWAGLIHEDVEISSINNRVDPHSITIDRP